MEGEKSNAAKFLDRLGSSSIIFGSGSFFFVPLPVTPPFSSSAQEPELTPIAPEGISELNAHPAVQSEAPPSVERRDSSARGGFF